MTDIKTIFLFLLVTLSCTSQSNTIDQNKTIATQLNYLINPVGDDIEDRLGAKKVSECVAIESQKIIAPDKYREFSSELNHYVIEVEKFVTNYSKIEDLSNYPKQSKKLHSYLNLLVTAVISCEEQIGVNVQF